MTEEKCSNFKRCTIDLPLEIMEQVETVIDRKKVNSGEEGYFVSRQALIQSIVTKWVKNNIVSNEVEEVEQSTEPKEDDTLIDLFHEKN